MTNPLLQYCCSVPALETQTLLPVLLCLCILDHCITASGVKSSMLSLEYHAGDGFSPNTWM